MGAQFVDSFDHYATAQIADKWSASTGGTLGVISGTGNSAIESGTGRDSTKCMKITQSSDAFSCVYKAMPSNASWVVGFAFNPSTFGTSEAFPFLEVHDTFPNKQLTFALAPTGFIQVFRGDHTGTLLGTTNQPVTAGVYDYWEFAFTINSSTGSVQIRKNGVTALNVSGVNTQVTGNSSANTILLGRTYGPLTWISSATCRYDDIYILDGTGSPNAFIGDVHFLALVPTADGAVTDWLPVGAANNFQCVREIPPDDDTTYVESNTPTDVDVYPVTLLPVTPSTVPLVQINLYARKDAAGVRTIQPEILQGGVYYPVGSAVSLGTVYTYQRTLLPLDPVGSPWTAATVNADEFGMKEVS